MSALAAKRARYALRALRAANQQDMGAVAGGMGAEATERLAELDACTRSYRMWSPALIPGVLQTSSYAAAAIKSRTPSLDATEMGPRLAARRKRAEAFLARHAGAPGPEPLAWFLIAEQAITRPLMNAFAHADQLRHLLAIAQDYGNIVIQVLREDSPMPGTLEPFSIHYLDPGPPVGHLETVIGGFYTINSDHIARLRLSLSEMVGFAMTPADSRDYISEVLHTCSDLSWGHTTEPDSASRPTATPTPASSSPGPTPEPSA